jgi:hypothetical protein
MKGLAVAGARIDAGTAVVEFVAAPVRQWEAVVPVAHACGQLVGDEMDDFALALDRESCWRQDDACATALIGRQLHSI